MAKLTIVAKVVEQFWKIGKSNFKKIQRNVEESLDGYSRKSEDFFSAHDCTDHFINN